MTIFQLFIFSFYPTQKLVVSDKAVTMGKFYGCNCFL